MENNNEMFGVGRGMGSEKEEGKEKREKRNKTNFLFFFFEGEVSDPLVEF